MAWSGTWGPMADGRSKLRGRIRQIERELHEVYDVTGKPRAARLVRFAATYEALAEQLLSAMGTDPKATPRRLGGLEKAASRYLGHLEALGVRRETPAPTIHEILADQQANGGRTR